MKLLFVHCLVPMDLGFVVQDCIQERVMDFYFSVVADESEFAEFVHKKADAGPGGADHLCQCLLADGRLDRLRAPFLPEMREQEEKAREPLLAGIEQLIDQVFLNPAVARQKIRHEQLGKLWLGMKEVYHGLLRYRGDQAFFHRRRGRDTQLMAVQATLAEELAGFQNRNHRLLSLRGQHGELDPSFLNVEDRIGDISLRENGFVLVKVEDRFPCPHFGEKHLGIKRVLGRFSHTTLPFYNCNVQGDGHANSTLVGESIWPGSAGLKIAACRRQEKSYGTHAAAH